jgi:hypothetical protein
MNDEIDRLQLAVSRHSHLGVYARQIGVERQGRTIVLTGRLPSYFLKQLFQEMVRRQATADEIENCVCVNQYDWLPEHRISFPLRHS